jgi:Icc-related predicted phosphoesterase
MRIYFTSDLHGSEKCWLKFLATPKFYTADVIIVGGDITGKFLVPFIQQPDGTVEVHFIGRTERLQKESDIEREKTQINNMGYYAFDTNPEEYELYTNDPGKIEGLFTKLLLERVEKWLRLAEERLKGQKVKVYVSAGNDDMFEVDDVLSRSSVIQHPDGKLVDIGGFEMISLGYANITPWNCTRDISEEDLLLKIEPLAKQIQHMERAIFNLHVPPYDSGIDQAPKLTKDLIVVNSPSGEPLLVPVGSTAVRQEIEKYQPMLGLHGHVHEARGQRKIGRTTVVNPGSEYAEGVLNGALIDVDPWKGLQRVNLVSG